MTKLSKKLIGLLIVLGASLVFLALQILLWEYSTHYQEFTRSVCTAIGLNRNTEWLRACSIVCYVITLPMAAAAYYFLCLLPRKRPSVADDPKNRRNMAIITGALALLFVLAIEPIFELFAPSYAAEAVMLYIMIALAVFCILWILATVHIPTLRRLKKPQLRRGAARYGLCIVISFLCAVCYGLILNRAAVWFPEAAKTLTHSATSDSMLLMGILTMVVFAPLVEELAFRGVMLRYMRRYMSPWIAVLVSSAFFAVWHRNPGQLFPTFAMGILFAWIYLSTGRLRYAMVVHSLSNLFLLLSLSLEVSYLPDVRFLYDLQRVILDLPGLVAVGALTAGILAIILIVERFLTSAEED